ncbi:MAG: GTPase [Mycoplasmoidaceae bacterium]
MDPYKRKCAGCANWLSKNKEDLGYIPENSKEKKLCMRCFKLTNYGEMTKFASNDFIEKQLEIFDPQKNLLILVIDLFDIRNSLIENVKKYENYVFVINHLAVLPKSINQKFLIQRLSNFFNKNGYFPIDILLYDGIEKKGIRAINDYINQAYDLKKKIYFIGKTNVGKSTLINALLKFNKIDRQLTVSCHKNTTLSYSKIKIKKTDIIDTPGYPNLGNILNNINADNYRKIINHKGQIKTFQIIDSEQMFFIDKLFSFIIYHDKEQLCTVKFFTKHGFKIHRSKVKDIDNIINNNNYDAISYNKASIFIKKEEKLDFSKRYNLFVSGIAIVLIEGAFKLEIFVPENINYDLTYNIVI